MMPSSENSRGDLEAPPCVVLIVGEQATLRDAALAGIRERVLGDATPEFNEDRFDLASAGTRPGQILDAARTLPVMAPRRLVIVRGLSHRRAADFIERELPAYLEDPVPSTCLVLEAVKVDQRFAWTKQIRRQGEIIRCTGPARPAELRAWIEARFRERRKGVSSGVAASLLEAVGRDLDALAPEVDKLCLFVGERPGVSTEDVAEVSGAVRPRAIYELTDAIGERRVAEALGTLAHLVDQGEAPLALLGALAGHFRRLMRASECTPLDAGEVQRTLSLHPYAARKCADQARRFGPRRLGVCLAAMRRTDEALKGGVPLAPRLVIEQLVLAVCS